jgi:hypothetical protein
MASSRPILILIGKQRANNKRQRNVSVFPLKEAGRAWLLLFVGFIKVQLKTVLEGNVSTTFSSLIYG